MRQRGKSIPKAADGALPLFPLPLVAASLPSAPLPKKRRRQWSRCSPYADAARIAGNATLAKYGREHYVSMALKSAAARRARRPATLPLTATMVRLQTRVTERELGAVRRAAKRLKVGQEALLRACLLSGLKAMGEELGEE